MVAHLAREIAEQPDSLRRLLDEETGHIAAIAGAVRAFDPAFVHIAARGTSDNAARYAQYALGIETGLAVALAAPSVHTLYGAQPRLGRALVMAISQSGRSTDVRQVLDDARAQGALTVSITNDPDSAIAQAAEHHIWLRCGAEKAVAATKTYTASVMALAMLVSALTGRSQMAAELRALPAHMEDTLRRAEDIQDWVPYYSYAPQFAVIGRGYNYCTAFEIGLKIKELNGLTCEQYSEADFRHGPIAMVQPRFPVLVVAPSGSTHALMADFLDKLQGRGANRIVIHPEGSGLPGERHMSLPPGLPEWLSPLCAVVPGQHFAMRLAESKGLSLDQPVGLTKVTETW